MKYSILAAGLALMSLLYFSCEKNNDVAYFDNDNSINIFPSEDNKELIHVSNVPELMATARLTKSGNKVVIIKEGIYELSEAIRISGNSVIYRGESGNKDKVILKGRGINGSVNRIFSVKGRNFAVKDLSIGEVNSNGIKLYVEKNTDSVHIQNVRFFDIKEQMILAAYNGDYSEDFADFGIIEQCIFEHTSELKPNAHRGGIDINRARNWKISNCTFKNINGSDTYQSTGAIRFRNHSENCIAENNIIKNCDRGIFFGFNNEAHNGGIIRNNMIYVNGKVGINICNAIDVKVYNNTVYNASAYPNAIECMNANKGIEIVNNLTNKKITMPEDMMSKVENNVTHAQEDWFKNASQGNLHLAKNISDVVDSAITLDDVTYDKDGDLRMQYRSDIGADER